MDVLLSIIVGGVDHLSLKLVQSPGGQEQF